MLAVSAILLVVFDGSGHRVHLLPADASAGPVLFGGVLLGVALTVVEQQVRRLVG